MSERAPRILIVGMIDSVHLARWVRMLAGTGWDVHVFPAYDAPAHALFEEATIYADRSDAPDAERRGVRLVGPEPWVSRAEKLARRTPNVRRALRTLAGKSGPVEAPTPAARLATLIERLEPDLIHSHEMQHSSYLALEARARLGGRFPCRWLASDWGNDLYLFGRLAAHADRIRAVLEGCDFYTAECRRDAELARKHGFRGEVLGIVPNGGGFDLDECRKLRAPGPTSARRVIALRGYQHWSGRALFGIRALRSCAPALEGYRVVVYSAMTEDVAIAVELAARESGLAIEVLPRVSHEEVLRLHGRARVSIGLSLSDAASTSFLEALVMGSFPIQSNTACADEWAKDGESALLVPPEDTEAIAAAIRRAVSDDALVDRAAEINAATAERLALARIREEVHSVYRRALDHSRGRMT
jgi:glycosyltransferase involved in cell wall biosynthesis